MQEADVLILGAGAAGLMAAIEAGKRGRRVLLIDHARAPAGKIRISGGGRCNFTNLHASPAHYISANKHFAKSALARYTPQDFLALVKKHNIKWHEKKLGQLFCDDSAQQIIDMLLAEAHAAGVQLKLNTSVTEVEKTARGYLLSTSNGPMLGAALVIACGGPSIPKMGSSGFGYKIAQQFGHALITPRAALVPLTFAPELLAQTAELSGVALEQVTVQAACGQSFTEDMLFTHRGLSGPVILQISSYWEEGEAITLNLCPGRDVLAHLKAARQNQPRQLIATVLGDLLPKRVAALWARPYGEEARIATCSDAKLVQLTDSLTRWRVTPQGSEGLRTAEVTRGGVDTKEVSSKTFESQRSPGLYFIGEVLDVTGHLGGYNFQWAWSSGVCAGQAV